MAENVRHHIKEEESEMFQKARDAGIDFVKLGERMLRRKEQLLDHGFPARNKPTKSKKARYQGLDFTTVPGPHGQRYTEH